MASFEMSAWQTGFAMMICVVLIAVKGKADVIKVMSII